MSTERIALISDIHGNELALRAVLGDIRRVGVDRIACLGDVAALGPRPREVIALLREHCELFIMGNHDEYMFEPASLAQHTSAPSVISAVHWCRAALTDDELLFLRDFEARRELSLGAAGSLLLFHGSPASNNCDLTAETPDAELTAQLAEQHATVMAGGHTHIQMLRQHHGTLLVNPGSVGLAFERVVVAGVEPKVMPWAEYAIVEARGQDLSVVLHRVVLNPRELLAVAGGWETEMGRYLVTQYRRMIDLVS